MKADGLTWLRQSSAEHYHLAREAFTFGEMTRVRCGLHIRPRDSYHVDPNSVPKSTPVVGKVCRECTEDL